MTSKRYEWNEFVALPPTERAKVFQDMIIARLDVDVTLLKEAFAADDYELALLVFSDLSLAYEESSAVATLRHAMARSFNWSKRFEMQLSLQGFSTETMKKALDAYKAAGLAPFENQPESNHDISVALSASLDADDGEFDGTDFLTEMIQQMLGGTDDDSDVVQVEQVPGLGIVITKPGSEE